MKRSLGAGWMVAVVASAAAVFGTPARRDEARAPALDGAALTPPSAHASLTRLPLSFEPNVGQLDARAAFVARAPGMAVLLEERGPSLLLSRRAPKAERHVRIGVAHARAGARIEGEERLGATSHYFRGAREGAWRTNVPTFARVRYEQILPGVDLVFHGSGQDVEYDFVIAPGASPDAIALDVEAEGDVSITPEGDLAIAMDDGVLVQRAPNVYQERGGERAAVRARYRLVAPGRVAFAVDDFDRSAALVIDPVLSYGTYLGGSDEDGVDAIAVDAHDDVYIAGQTASLDFPLKGAEQAALQGTRDAFVAKIDGRTHALLYSTYFGGTGDDEAIALAPMVDGSIVAGGRTNSTDLPTTVGAPQRALAGVTDGFIVRLDASGASLAFASYLGGEAEDYVWSLAGDAAGAIYATGSTQSASFPTAHALYTTRGGARDAFVTKLEASGAIGFSTYLGGSGFDDGRGIAVTPAGRIAITGQTTSSDFPIQGALQPALHPSDTDAFVTVLAPGGQSFVYSTFLGGSQLDHGDAVGCDSAERVYVAGTTQSADLPVRNAAQAAIGSHASTDAFLARIEADGSALGYATYLGGELEEDLAGLSVTPEGHVFVVGTTFSAHYPTLRAIQATRLGLTDLFAAAYDPDGALSWSTFYGTTSSDTGRGIAIDHQENAYLAGVTAKDGVATVGALQAHPGGSVDAFLVELGGVVSASDGGVPIGDGGADAGDSGESPSDAAGADAADASQLADAGHDAEAGDAANQGDGASPVDASDASSIVDAGGEDGSSLADAGGEDGSLLADAGDEDGASAPESGAEDGSTIADARAEDGSSITDASHDHPIVDGSNAASNDGSLGDGDDASGCSCHTAGGGEGAGRGLALFALALTALVRRRRRGPQQRSR